MTDQAAVPERPAQQHLLAEPMDELAGVSQVLDEKFDGDRVRTDRSSISCGVGLRPWMPGQCRKPQ